MNLTRDGVGSPEGNPFLLPYLYYDEYSDLLGGGFAEDVVDFERSSAHLSHRTQSLNEITREITQRINRLPQFLFSVDSKNVLPLEILWLKWNLFSDLCIRLQEFYKRHNRPHLNISPESVYTTMPDNVTGLLPARMVYKLDIADSSACPIYSSEEVPPDLVSSLFFPPPDPESLFVSPLMKKIRPGYEEKATVLIRTIERVEDKQDTAILGVVQLHAIAEGLRSQDYTDKDLFGITLSLPDTDIPPVKIWAKKVVSMEQGITLSGTTEKLSQEVWKGLKGSTKSVFYNSVIKVFPCYNIPLDIYSLGIMLFRLLLVNKQTGLPEVIKRVMETAQRIEPMVQGLDPLTDSYTLIKRFKARLEREGIFHKNAVLFYQKEDDTTDFDMNIPEIIWFRAIITGFRMITWMPGFSFCSNHGDFDPDNLNITINRVKQCVEDVSRQIRTELFDYRQRNREILDVCNIIRGELTDRKTVNAV